MASVASPSSHSSRRRGGTNSKEATTEDQALNMIAREAEARLAAKRAARAEARSIRMKEIERKQKEADDDDVTSEDNDPPDDNMYIKRAGRMSSPTLPTYDITDTVPSMQVTNDAHVIQLKDAVKEGEVRYKKAMVNAAQLDNERQALQYQVEVLKDIIEELQEKIENTDDELAHKCREYNKLSREHSNTTSELKKCLFLLEDRERVLDENGINIDGTIKEGYTPPSSQCSICSASLNDAADTVDDHRERGSLLAEIASLRNEIEDLKQTSNSEHSRRELESMKTEREGVELEQSFADVSNEAAVIREDALHTGLYINNNEKNDDFEMIDDGSQQGGIRHFEDQSFEKSTSSLTSSSLTDALTSMESSVPLEISVDNIRKHVAKDDYDIVHVEDSTKTASMNVDSYTRLEYIPSVSSSSGGEPSSDINVNKYLFHEHDDVINDDSDHYNAFSVDRYFAAESINCSIATEENNELQTSVDTITNVQSDYDTIDTEDVIFNPDSQFVQEESRNSPYEDVQVESFGISTPSDGMVIIEESKTSDKISFDETSVESTDIRLLEEHVVLDSKSEREVVTTDLDIPASVQILSEDQSEVTTVTKDVNTVEQHSSLPTLPCDTTASSNNSMERDMVKNTTETTTFFPCDSGISTQYDTCGVAATGIESSTSFVASQHNALLTSNNTPVKDSPTSMNAAVCPDDAVPVDRVESITETDKNAIRHDVEKLYNLIAEEANEPSARHSSSGSGALTDDEKRGWLVQVESFSTPDVGAPEIKIVDVGQQVEPTPEAKERKKKKKKKKHEKTEEGNVANLQSQNTVVPSDPLLLGFATEPDGATPHSSDNTTEITTRKSDIPKQFLDASAELIDNSYSDVSDNEDGDIGEDGKKKSSKRSKKEGCKSQ